MQQEETEFQRGRAGAMDELEAQAEGKEGEELEEVKTRLAAMAKTMDERCEEGGRGRGCVGAGGERLRGGTLPALWLTNHSDAKVVWACHVVCVHVWACCAPPCVHDSMLLTAACLCLFASSPPLHHPPPPPPPSSSTNFLLHPPAPPSTALALPTRWEKALKAMLLMEKATQTDVIECGKQREDESIEQELREMLMCRVRISGLVGRPELNERVGTITRYVKDKGRFAVAVDRTEEEHFEPPEQVLLKQGNLTVVTKIGADGKEVDEDAAPPPLE